MAGLTTMMEKTCILSVSHSENFIICAADPLESVGVDIEKMEKINFTEIAKECFTEIEIRMLHTTKDAEQLKQKFYEIWTLKECYLKYDGRGLNIPLQSFYFTWDSDTSYILHLLDGSHQHFKIPFFYNFVAVNYMISIATPRKFDEVKIKTISQDELSAYFGI